MRFVEWVKWFHQACLKAQYVIYALFKVEIFNIAAELDQIWYFIFFGPSLLQLFTSAAVLFCCQEIFCGLPYFTLLPVGMGVTEMTDFHF